MAKIIKLIKRLLGKSKTKELPIRHDHIISRTQHRLSKTDISTNALKVLNRLNSAGFQAYLVGGSVRDLLLGKKPKDFDVATNATPNEIRRLFSNARIIGRRFKLVHILFNRDIIEVATFRGNEEPNELDENQKTNERGMLIRDNVYGSFDEDAWRRDFSINSLYYNIVDSSIIDFTGGFKDIESRTLRIIGEPTTRYQEDPVRMLRAIRFSAKLQFKMDKETAAPIPNLANLIRHVSGSRLFDEMTKLYQCGEGESVQRLLIEHGLFTSLFEQTAKLSDSNHKQNALISFALESTDRRVKESKPVTPAFLYAVLLWFPLQEKAMQLQQEENLPPLPALEKAMSLVISIQNQVVTIPKRFSLVMREIWLLQFRFSKRSGRRAFQLLQHPRFRASYDFLVLRALAGDEQIELADWWTKFQDADEAEKEEMVKIINQNVPSPRKRKYKPKKTT